MTSPQAEAEKTAGGSNPVAELVDGRAADRRLAFVEGSTGRGLSWAQLYRRVGHWYAFAAGVGPATRVGLLIDDPVEMAIAVVGGLASGVTIAPLDPGAPAAELAARAEALGLGAVVTVRPSRPGPIRDAERSTWAAPCLEVWETGSSGFIRVRGRVTRVPVVGGDADLLMSSSGTTGVPKLIPLSVGQLVHTASGVVAHHDFGRDDRVYSPLPLHHINGLVVGVLASLVGGYRLVLDRRFSASSCWEVAARHEVTWLNLVPAIISVLARRPGPAPDVAGRIRFARSASAPLAATTRRAFEDRTGIRVVETYGMTEAASQITACSSTEPERRTGSVGVPVGVELRVVDDRRLPAPPDVTGQVEIRGPSVVETYLGPAGAPNAARPATHADGWLTTGDLGYLDADGYLFLVGRSDDVINRGGEKVYPREIEDVLLADPAVADAAVVGRPDPTLGQVAVAFVIGDGSVEDGELGARLASRCDRRLSRSRRPAEVIVADRLPTGPTGKIKRSELRRLLTASSREGRAAQM
jgi:acyl-CoA synthetase (AMP-forming)/AMP-acid ligase II